ncbi:hypothetical protein V5799_033800 [Amblyomma americanum]|uniref:Uncharacterized protein n=1 Tax=Amblyomma americanum TaxID=6943 RepID=A0AAQ4DMA1_AMBAM
MYAQPTNLYDRINTSSCSPIKCPPSDACGRARDTLTAALKRDNKENDTPPTAEPTLSPPESAVTNKVTEQPQDIPRPAERGNGESMEVDPAAAKRRRDDVDAMSPEQRQRPPQSQRDAGDDKKQRVTSGQRSSSRPRDDNKS